MTSSSSSSLPTVTLNDGVHIPQLGFGVWQVPAGDTAAAVSHALQAGYRHVDTAAIYGNEAGVGTALARSGLAREEVFVTTKCWNSDQGYGSARAALAASLERLGLSHVDLYLIHWPVPSQDRYVETWRAFIELREEGLARSIGVSNFQPVHLTRLIQETGEVPSVNQVELHPYLAQAPLRSEHEALGIATEAWSPLASGDALADPVLSEIAETHGVTVAQVIIRWHLQLGNIVIPKSVSSSRISANFDVFGFSLERHELELIGSLETGRRTGPDPDTFR